MSILGLKQATSAQSVECIDCMAGLDKLVYRKGRLIFLDPPDNIGLGYKTYKDDKPDYYEWLTKVITTALTKADVVWISYYYRHDPFLALLALHSGAEWLKVLWVFTFGQYNDKGLANGYRPQLCLYKTPLNYDSIRVVSERMLLGDKRAAGLRVPDDVWAFPRVVGNNPERRSWHPTQHPEELVERVISLSGCSNVVDLFAGTGTVHRVCKRRNMECLSFDLDEQYCHNIEHNVR